MKKSRFTEAQTMGVLRESEGRSRSSCRLQSAMGPSRKIPPAVAKSKAARSPLTRKRLEARFGISDANGSTVIATIHNAAPLLSLAGSPRRSEPSLFVRPIPPATNIVDRQRLNGGITVVHDISHGLRASHQVKTDDPRRRHTQNAYVERYNRTVRHEWLNLYIFERTEMQEIATEWLWTYNQELPNMGIGGITPAQKLKMAAWTLPLPALQTGRITKTDALELIGSIPQAETE